MLLLVLLRTLFWLKRCVEQLRDLSPQAAPALALGPEPLELAHEPLEPLLTSRWYWPPDGTSWFLLSLPWYGFS